jgi:Cytochrome c peroxidase
MNLRTRLMIAFLILCIVAFRCSEEGEMMIESTVAIERVFGSNVDFDNLPNYSAPPIPVYITKDNGINNPIDNKKAMLGRILFYDKNLSVNNTISCSSCHQQQFAFSDVAGASKGFAGGNTTRHSMRLINARYSNEMKFFWDERAATLEAQTTRPIQDHVEMGFSGQDGDPSLNDLTTKLKAIDYYQELFTKVYGDVNITEQRMQESLAQFVRSIQSFDSKYDAGRVLTGNDGAPFPNFSPLENQGKNLFLTPPQFNADGIRTAGGAGCGGCHRAPEFDIDPNSRNNGITNAIGGGTDFAVTRSPSLRDVVKSDGTANGPFMHVGNSDQLITVIEHYNLVLLAAGNNNLDPRLRPNGRPQNLQLTQTEKDALIAFIRTLGGTNVYKDTKWATPFK